MHVIFDSMEVVGTSLILVGTYIKKKDTVSHVLHFLRHIFILGKHRR